MAHSRIFQMDLKPIAVDEYITEDYFYDDFVGSVADYVDGYTNRAKDIDWLFSNLYPYGVKFDEKEGSMMFDENFKQTYFAQRFHELKEELNKMTLKEFAEDGYLVYSLSRLIEDKYGFYIYYEYLMTLDDFVRQAEVNVKYYVGKTIDYHY